MEIPRKWKTASDDSDEENKTFDFDLAGASTPLKSIPNLRPQESSTIFLSPINKLHNLHLNTSPERGIQEEEEDEESDYNEAEQTIASDGSVEFKDDEDKEEEELISNPMYINSKKRGMDSPLDMIITPRVGKRLGSISSVKSDSNMSICNASNVSVSLFKLSFSNSDSTPCPRQPRKRLKFKDTTPSGTPLSLGKRKNLLNLSSSKKASISILTQFTEAQEELSGDDVDENDLDDDIHKHDNGDDGNYESYENYEESDLNGTPNTESSKFPNLNTPISQSTPANSRPPTPPLIEEYGDPIKGYKLLREQSSDADIQNPYYSYKTPENNKNLSYSQMMRNSYIGGNPTPELSQNTSGSGYQIVGEFPVTSAGLMNEDDVDLHIGDKRINDPYNSGASTPGFNSTPGFKSTPGGSKLKFQSMTDDSRRQEIKDEYLNGGKLPLLKQFETNLSTEEIISLINDDKSLFEFYEYITNDGNDNKNNNNSNNNIDMDILDMVKKERLKWHPDKWIGNITVDKEVIENLSKALNTLVERLR